MKTMTEMRGSLDEGRALQFEAMMEQLSALQAKYKGVRGELLAKVREEFMRLKPDGAEAPRPPPVRLATAAPSKTPPHVAKMLPSCRACGRSMRPGDTEGMLVCQNGHTRLAV